MYCNQCFWAGSCNALCVCLAVPPMVMFSARKFVYQALNTRSSSKLAGLLTSQSSETEVQRALQLNAATMQRLPCMNITFVVLCCAISGQATRVPLGITQARANSTAAFECGKPLGPCDKAIPAGVLCDKGPGYCQTGYFCGWEQNTRVPLAKFAAAQELWNSRKHLLSQQHRQPSHIIRR